MKREEFMTQRKVDNSNAGKWDDELYGIELEAKEISGMKIKEFAKEHNLRVFENKELHDLNYLIYSDVAFIADRYVPGVLHIALFKTKDFTPAKWGELVLPMVEQGVQISTRAEGGWRDKILEFNFRDARQVEAVIQALKPYRRTDKVPEEVDTECW